MCFTQLRRAIARINGTQKTVSPVFAAALLCFSASGGAVAQDSLIQLQVTQVDPKRGQVLVYLYDSAESFLKEPVQEAVLKVDNQGRAKFVFDSQPIGMFAIAIAHDTNLNGKLDRNFLGIPKEKTGFSNNARGSFGPPKWRDVRFDAGEKGVTVQIELSQPEDIN